MRGIAWRHAVGLIRKDPGTFAASLAGHTVYNALALAPGLLNRSILDSLSGNTAAAFNVWTLIALIAASELARLGASYFATVSLNLFAYTGEALLKWNMLRFLVDAPGARVLPSSTGEAVSRFRDDTLDVARFTALLTVLPQLFTAIVGFVIMLSINAQIALFVVLPLTATIVSTYLLGRGIQRYRRAAREATAEVTSFIGEIFSSVQAVKLAGAEARLMGQMAEFNNRRRDASIRDAMFNAGLAAFTANLATLGTGFVLLLAAHAMRLGTFTVGDFALFANYMGWASAAPLLVGQLLAMERQSRVSIQRIHTLVDGAPPLGLVDRRGLASKAAQSSREPLEVLTVRGLTRLHPESGRGARNIDLTIRRGTLVVVTGPVGSGKTTLLRALLGLIPRDAGEIAWNGRIVADPSTFMTPPRCAYTAQSPRLFSETLGENLQMGAAAGTELLAAAVERAVFEEDVASFDQGLATRIGTRGVTLSGGQLQRAAMARMFAREPELIVLDDVSSALDVDTERLLWQRIFASGQQTCLAVSHRREALRRADEIVVMDEGLVVARGDLATVLSISPLFRRSWEALD